MTPLLTQLKNKLNPNQRGALWMLVSALTFSLMTSLVKYLGTDYPAVLQTFYRQLATLLVMVPVILRSPTPVFRTSKPAVVLYRAFASFFGMSLAFYSYQHLPLADANALSFTRALWVVILAALLLRESFGVARIVATLCGFLGVLLVVNPTQQSISGAALAALLSAFFLATTVTGMKSLTKDHSITTVMAFSSLLGVLFALPAAIYTWRWPDAIDLVLLATMGALGVVTQACYIKGMALGEASVMASMDYSRLLFSVLAGWWLFNSLPSHHMLLGTAVIVAATLYITVVDTGTRPRDA